MTTDPIYALQEIAHDLKALAALECLGVGVSTDSIARVIPNTNVKRDAPGHGPIGVPYEGIRDGAVRRVFAIAAMLKYERLEAEVKAGRRETAMAVALTQAKRRLVLAQTGATPVEAAFLGNYSSDKSVRELRHRRGLNEKTGYPLQIDERPLTRKKR